MDLVIRFVKLDEKKPASQRYCYSDPVNDLFTRIIVGPKWPDLKMPTPEGYKVWVACTVVVEQSRVPELNQGLFLIKKGPASDPDLFSVRASKMHNDHYRGDTMFDIDILAPDMHSACDWWRNIHSMLNTHVTPDLALAAKAGCGKTLTVNGGIHFTFSDVNVTRYGSGSQFDFIAGSSTGIGLYDVIGVPSLTLPIARGHLISLSIHIPVKDFLPGVRNMFFPIPKAPGSDYEGYVSVDARYDAFNRASYRIEIFAVTVVEAYLWAHVVCNDILGLPETLLKKHKFAPRESKKEMTRILKDFSEKLDKTEKVQVIKILVPMPQQPSDDKLRTIFREEFSKLTWRDLIFKKK